MATLPAREKDALLDAGRVVADLCATYNRLSGSTSGQHAADRFRSLFRKYSATVALAPYAVEIDR